MKCGSKTHKQAFFSQMGLIKRVKIGKRKPFSLKTHYRRIYSLIFLGSCVFLSFFYFFWLIVDLDAIKDCKNVKTKLKRRKKPKKLNDQLKM